MPLVSIILVSYNTSALTAKSIASVYASHGFRPGDLEVILVDNASSDNTVKVVKAQFPQVKIINNSDNVGFGRANNQAAALALGQYLLFLNTDAFLRTDTLRQLLDSLDTDRSLLAIAPRLTYADGLPQSSTGYFPTLLRLQGWMLWLDRIPGFTRLFGAYHLNAAHQNTAFPDWVMGACFLIHSADFAAVKGFDEQIFMYAEEVDLFWRLRDRFPQRKVRLLSKIQIVHLGSASGGADQGGRLVKELHGIEYIYRKRFPGIYWLMKIVLVAGVAMRVLVYSLIPGKKHLVAEYNKYFAK